MIREKKEKRREKTIEEQHATCFGILDLTDEYMDRILKMSPYIFSRLKEI